MQLRKHSTNTLKKGKRTLSHKKAVRIPLSLPG
jgi:hypothetical protein